MLTYTQLRAARTTHRMLSLQVIFLCAVSLTAWGVCRAQRKDEQKHATRKPNLTSGKATFLRYCASCHGVDAKGGGPAALALQPPPSDLTTLTKRYDGKFPAGYVGALVKFGRDLAAHGSEDMPVWGSRFKSIDPAGDPTGQQHVDDLVAYLETLQMK